VLEHAIPKNEEPQMTDRNRRMVLAERPTGTVDERTVRLEETDLPEPGPGEALAKVRYLDRPHDPHLDGRRAGLPAADRHRRGRAQQRRRRGARQ
jgi:hypothetical protein